MLLVTGASRGIGAAVARLAGARGFAVGVNYGADAESANGVVRDIMAAGGRAVAVQADLGIEADIVRMFGEIDAQLGPVTALVNNAGITGGFCRTEDIGAETLARVLAVNVTGVFIASREAIRRMSTKHGGQGGAIVNISSRAAGLGGGGEWIHYAASKGAVETFTVGLAREVAREGIRVNAVAPGLIRTDLHALAGEPGRVDRLSDGVPMGRPGTAEEIAEPVLWLVSAAASYTTGTIVHTSGGR